MYSHDGFGLGHLKRNVILAQKALQKIPRSRVFLLMGHPTFPFSSMLPYGADFIKLPSLVKVNTGEWRSRNVSIPNATLKRLRSSLILQTARALKPDIFLVDYAPQGVWKELCETLKLLKRQNHSPVILLGLRDVLDDDEVTFELWKKEGNYEALARYYDKILIYGCREIFDTAQHYRFDGELADKTYYCGYICPSAPYQSREGLRREMRITDEKFIVITAGGGADAYPMMSLSMKAIAQLSPQEKIKALLITGPLMNREQREELYIQARGLPVELLSAVEDTSNYLNAADLVITMGGYNALMESLCLRKPTLVIPRRGPSAEQQIRTRLFSELKLIHGLAPADVLSVSELSWAIQKKLGEPFNPSMTLGTCGQDRAVELMRELLEERQTRKLSV